MTAGISAGAGESPDRTLVCLARHGQIPLNESDVLRVLADPPLDEVGQDQAQRLGWHWARWGCPPWSPDNTTDGSCGADCTGILRAARLA
jgi:hypothetical protein